MFSNPFRLTVAGFVSEEANVTEPEAEAEEVVAENDPPAAEE